MANLFPNALKQSHIKIFDDLLSGRLDALEVEKVLLYIIDTVDADALPLLAAQFDILGIKGYGFATTEAEKRDVVRNAIELHRYKGTIWSIKEALRKLGLTVARIEEHVGTIPYYNGTYNYNGSITYGSTGHWAYFRVIFDPAQNPPLTATLLAAAYDIINEYKNVRSWLFDITAEINVAETLTITEGVTGLVEGAAGSPLAHYFDGARLYDGSIAYDALADDVEVVQDAVDIDVQAFMLATGISNFTIQDALDTLVTDLKAANLWAKLQAIYPMVGGTASTHKYNLKNPLDSDAAFRLVFAGGWTHSATGALPNGTNGYADTKFVPATHGVAASNLHISYYSRQNSTGSYLEMGVAGNSGLSVGAGQLYISPNLSGTNFRAVNMTGNQGGVGINAQGYFIATRNNASFMQFYRNGTLVANDAGTPNTAADYAIFVGGRNNNGTADVFSNRECAFATIGEGLDATEAANLNTIIQAFQTALSR